jgi:hypothetical protein
MSGTEDFLVGNGIQLALVMATILAIVVPIWWTRYQGKKRLSFEILEVDVPASMPGLEVTHKGQPIPEAHLCTFKLSNTGRKEIAEDDFETGSPISVGFKGCPEHPDQPSAVLAFDLRAIDPGDLQPKISITNEGKLEVQPMLWNSGDSVTIRVLLAQCFDRDVSIRSRIKGVKNIQPPRIPKRSPLLIPIIGTSLYIGGFVAFFLGYNTVGIGWLVAGLLALAIGMRRFVQYSRTMRRLGFSH